MAKISRPRLVRPFPRRSPYLYPIGTTLTLRDGRTFEVAGEITVEWATQAAATAKWWRLVEGSAK